MTDPKAIAARLREIVALEKTHRDGIDSIRRGARAGHNLKAGDALYLIDVINSNSTTLLSEAADAIERMEKAESKTQILLKRFQHTLAQRPLLAEFHDANGFQAEADLHLVIAMRSAIPDISLAADEIARLRKALTTIGEGVRDGQDCAHIARQALSGDTP